MHDNAGIADQLVTGTERQYPNRLGQPIRSFNGMNLDFDESQAERDAEFGQDQAEREEQFQQFLLSSGYEDIGDYAAGLIITGRNQVFLRSGQYYRAKGSLALPYTTTGNWASESSSFVSVGDAVLRQDLAQPDGDTLVRTRSGRTQRQKNDEWVSVADYGGAPTGDSTASVAAAAAAAGPGGQIYIPFDTFTVSNNANAGGCRVLGSNTKLTGMILNHAGMTGVLVGGGAQDRLKIALPESSEHNPLLIYRQKAEKYFVMSRKPGHYKGGVIEELLWNLTTTNASVGVNQELLRATRVHNCTGIYAWQSGPSGETGTWQAYTLTDTQAGHSGDNLQRAIVARRSTTSGATATYSVTVPRDGKFNLAFMGSMASPSSVEIRIDGTLIKTINPQTFVDTIYAVPLEAAPGARTVLVTAVGAGTVYLIGANFHSIREARPGVAYNNWAAYRDVALTHYILSEGAHDYAIFDRTTQLWAGSYHGGETLREPRQFLIDNVPNNMTDAQVICAGGLAIRQKTKIDWTAHGGGAIWANSELRFADGQSEFRVSLINDPSLPPPNIQRLHTGMNGVNEAFTSLVYPREQVIGADEIDLGQSSKLIMQHDASRAVAVTDVNLHPDMESDRSGIFITPATGAYNKVYYPWVMNGSRAFTNLSFTCRRTFR
ncbi:hypothetical protein [Pseudomonas kurunegalensis]|uniref:hypothetical protein n=1 Tax=Pseudomonas kurunegalensis TaxID=485880 RepID=UPI004027B07E